jgi:hypothetical protein
MASPPREATQTSSLTAFIVCKPYRESTPVKAAPQMASDAFLNSAFWDLPQRQG